MPPGLTSRVTRDNKSTLSGWLPAWKKQLPQTGRQAPQQKQDMTVAWFRCARPT